MPGPIVEAGDDLVLRTVEREDAEFVQRLFADPWARVGFQEHGHKNHAEVEELLEGDLEESDTAAYLACVDDDDAPWGHPEEDETTPVAFVAVTHVDRDRPGVNHWVAPAFRGEGYGVEALSLAVDTVLRTYDPNTIGVEVVAGDEATREHVEAVGFVEEGRNREVLFVEGEYRDVYQYGLLHEEWEGR
ncbi:GNAT family N-acetyltransferase [Halostella pelagica]|uniref:GNAT family N-acetyltransferase n=1 Tax=Halostella pelagica TaxID=2583824 RepID=UPI00108141F4|nr:GNAT family protein [Halostella pelagica]